MLLTFFRALYDDNRNGDQQSTHHGAEKLR